MIDHSIYITAADIQKLHDLVVEAQRTIYRNSAYLQMLSRELARATVIAENKVPPNVITMNSQAFLADIDTGEEMDYTLVFPEEADAGRGKISVLAPIGTAMLGCRVRDEFEWDTPGGKRRIRVERVIFQPEASSRSS